MFGLSSLTFVLCSVHVLFVICNYLHILARNGRNRMIVGFITTKVESSKTAHVEVYTSVVFS